MLRLTLVWSLYLTSSKVGSHRPLSSYVCVVSPASLCIRVQWCASATLTETTHNLENVFSVFKQFKGFCVQSS